MALLSTGGDERGPMGDEAQGRFCRFAVIAALGARNRSPS
jgi:hypothetical protein